MADLTRTVSSDPHERKDCEDCHGRGWLLMGNVRIESCDECNQIADDAKAAIVAAEDVYIATHGACHAVVKARFLEESDNGWRFYLEPDSQDASHKEWKALQQVLNTLTARV